MARINRKLHPSFEQLHRLRGERGFTDLGEYYVIDHNRNVITQTHVSVPDLACDMDVLKPYEVVE